MLRKSCIFGIAAAFFMTLTVGCGGGDSKGVIQPTQMKPPPGKIEEGKKNPQKPSAE